MIDIAVVPFKLKHMPMLIELHASQNYPDMPTLTYKTLPKVGCIALLGKQPIAAGFLRRLEPCYAQLDTLVSNAHFGSQIRHLGVKKVVDSLIESANDLKLEGILALTKDAGTLERAQGLGFRLVDQQVIALSLEPHR